MIPNDSLERISCSLKEIARVFDRVSTSLADMAPDLRAFVFATMSADAAMRAQDSYREQEQQEHSSVSPRPNETGVAVVAPLRGKNRNELSNEDAPNAKPTPDYAGKPRNRHQIHRTAKDVGLKGNGSWCE